ncbi:MAG: hypothetical protein O2955_18665 [Planctomycetota bacterium]|nr:hypothetical protein [Planctomycetota bacterium]MDA1214537.1 hypothetical protein [Planctomycetota bacterium]
MQPARTDIAFRRTFGRTLTVQRGKNRADQRKRIERLSGLHVVVLPLGEVKITTSKN